MEDIEDVIAGGAAPGLSLPPTSVSMKPRRKLKARLLEDPSPHIPGTQTIYMKTFGCSHNQSDSEYMAGQLSAFGYALTDSPEEADLWLINTCTVKSPSQSAMETLILKCKTAKKPLVVAGCVPQGSRDLKELEGISIIGVQQIDRVVDVVEETLKGHEVRLLNRKMLPSLDLPKVRKNKFIEILPINVGCLGACTYCKTKHARGHLGSYTVESLVERVRTVISEGVREIWLSSEDTGAYGRDIGANLPILLNALVAELPGDGSTMLRIGMTNPPFILEHLEEIAKVLCHPCVYAFLHVPVQSGSDAVLDAMNREYSVRNFKTVVDTLIKLVPEMQIATDVICGFPGESEEDFAQTITLIKEYQFPQVHISQFYPRPGTRAARMKKVPSTEVKKRSRELTSIFESFNPYEDMEGRVKRIWITEIASDGVHLVGHTKGYVQVLLVAPDNMLGTSAEVKITSVGRWSVFGELIEIPKKSHRISRLPNSTAEPPSSDSSENFCACPSEFNCCLNSLENRLQNAGELNSTLGPPSYDSSKNFCALPSKFDCCLNSLENTLHNAGKSVEERGKRFVTSVQSNLLRRRKGWESIQSAENAKEISEGRIASDLAMMDKLLIGGVVLSLLTIVVLLSRLSSQLSSS
ncbi:CDK5RAP1-like protein [Apostasia shenzhenica]|uniref:Threonylcarbamoyladenosine tRNA methylthiotransferase n=1 Tax=Apostasia shenzhenica TaxID=1088818 RepID=A0A2I0B405_9ASPA|nr:CDK5RAP1-like protein [Apostasia shenzhenica]